MELQTFTVQTRSDKGKGPSGRMRYEENVPGVIYGAGKENVNIMVGSKELEYLLHHGQGQHAMVDLTISDNPELNGPAMVKAVQHHPVKGNALHFDLMRIDLTQKIVTVVPIKIEGRSAGIIEGGVLDHQLREIEVECLPLDVPEAIIGDITHLEIGQSLHVNELAAIENVVIITDSSRTVAAVHQPRVIEETVVEVEGEEGLEGAVEGEGEGDEAAATETTEDADS